ncbi:MAG: thioredoxin family protein [Opitutae bacterium]|nr:thioredoxin family protein [Opitutae bacterium]
MRYLVLLALLASTTALRAEPEYPKAGPDVYDTQADGTAQVDEAVRLAKRDQKQVLVVFGANWCIWCRRLHELFENNSAVRRELKAHYIVVHVDVNHRDGKKRNDAVNERFGNPIKNGLPVLVLLDRNGHMLTTQETGALEDGKSAHDPDKVVAFLRQWQPE